MSYKRAWYLVEAMNGHFDRPLVETSKGGKSGGGAKLTQLGEDVLGAFRCEPEGRLLYLTYSGKLALVSMADVPLHQRSSKGTRVRTFDGDPAVAVALAPAPAETRS